MDEKDSTTIAPITWYEVQKLVYSASETDTKTEN